MAHAVHSLVGQSDGETYLKIKWIKCMLAFAPKYHSGEHWKMPPQKRTVNGRYNIARPSQKVLDKPCNSEPEYNIVQSRSIFQPALWKLSNWLTWKSIRKHRCAELFCSHPVWECLSFLIWLSPRKAKRYILNWEIIYNLTITRMPYRVKRDVMFELHSVCSKYTFSTPY